MLVDGGHYFTQHVGHASAFEQIEHFLGPLPEHRRGRDPVAEVAAAEEAGLVVEDLRTSRFGWSSTTSGRSCGSCASACGGSRASRWTGTTASCGSSTPRCRRGSVANNFADGGACTINVAEEGRSPILGLAIRESRFDRDTRHRNCAILAPTTTKIATAANYYTDGQPVVVGKG